MNTGESKEKLPEVRRMIDDDVSFVVNVWNKTKINFESEDDLVNEKNRESGFFVREFSDMELKTIIDLAESICLIRRLGNKVEGFLIATSLNAWLNLHPDWEKMATYKKEEVDPDKTMWVYSIFSDHSNPRLAITLHKKLKESAVAKGFTYELGQILETPVENIRSERFHEALGFSKVGTRKDSYEGQELVWGVYGRRIT